MLRIIDFNSDYGYIKQDPSDSLTINLKNKKDIKIYKSYCNKKDYKLGHIDMEDQLICIIESEQQEYFVHIKNEILYITPYLNDRTEGSLNILIESYTNRFEVEKTEYSYYIIDTETEYKIELTSFLFTKKRKQFINNAKNNKEDPYIFLKIFYLNYTTFLEYTISKKDFAFKTNVITNFTPSKLSLDFKSANELIIKNKSTEQIVKLSTLRKYKDIKLNKTFDNDVPSSVLFKINNTFYIINNNNDKLSIKTDTEQQLLYKNSGNLSIQRKGAFLLLKGSINYNINIKPDSFVTKDGILLSKIIWKTDNQFYTKLKIKQLKYLPNIHNTIFFAINNKKLNVLKQYPDTLFNKRVLSSFNYKGHAIIIRKNAANNISIGNLKALKIYSPLHKLKIDLSKKIAKISRFLNSKKRINLFFEKEASRAVESGKFVFEAVQKIQHSNSKNFFILDKKSLQYNEMKKKWGNKIIKRFSFKNYLYIFLADHFIASELSNHVINSRVFNDKLNSKIKSTPLYFLQHGIIFMKPHDDPKISGFHKKSMNSNIIKSVVSSEVEAKEFNIMGYNDFEIMKTGLPKLDNASLIKSASKITYMPTWRPWEEAQILNGDFKNTTYYDSLIEVISTFEKAGMIDRLQIAAHNKFTEFAKKHLQEYKNIFVDDPSDTLTNSIIYITDISSIILDATYRGAYPIFYWKDFETIIEKHGGTTPVNENNAPGIVVYSEKELLEAVKKAIDDNYKIPHKVLSNYKKINEFEDNRNTERVINELLNDKVL